ncbi:hypothetical protein RB653_005412 [Dictyostelium firmibasis]|uniref:Uncharacterized protein n=1 Tax=Dictyostelium firmibasis TaxID=79012 RepID=A0AAN7U9V5_9MYCE
MSRLIINNSNGRLCNAIVKNLVQTKYTQNRNYCSLQKKQPSSQPSQLPPLPLKSSKPNMMEIVTHFFDKVKKKSFIIDNHLNDQSGLEQQLLNRDIKYNTENDKDNIQQIKLLDPLNNLGIRKGNEIFKVVENDLTNMTNSIMKTITDGVSANSTYSPAPLKKTHPILSSISSYYFELKGKRIRPTIVLLLAKALSPTVHGSQLKLAEVVEMIHTASLVHDDVIDEASTRRDVVSINHSYTNKLAILCGDYLLARASVVLSTIRNPDVTECMSTALAELVEGEFMQAKSNGAVSFDNYLQKTYLKTGSLITNSCRSAAILSGADSNIINISTEFGKNLGLAFQIIDDLLDYTGSAEECGKATSVDLTLGLATAPVLYATQEFPQLEKLIKRKFSEIGDVEEAKRLVALSKGIEKTRNLAIEYCNRAIQSLLKLPQSESRDLLITLSHTVVTRTK